MSEDDEDFKDALDKIEEQKMFAVPTTSFRNRPSQLPIINDPVDQQPHAATFITNSLMTPNHPSTPQDLANSTTRRDRLTALRKRMREEFGTGARDLTTPVADVDTLSVVSDATSLHSWHRRVLAGSDTVVVRPSDSMSTRAASTAGYGAPWSPHGEMVLPRIPSVSEEEVTMTDAATTTLHVSPTGPPPSHPPPPLPGRERSSTSGELRSPPPLPPRNPSIRLPEPVSPDVFREMSSSNEDNHYFTPTTKPLENPLAKDLSERSQRMSTNSNESVATNGENSTRRRGHAKTNSLDRGLTLAKSLKAGPFPPPANKSNSLTRQEVVILGEEEEERNSAAEGIIRQITTAVITDKDSDLLEPINSGSSSVSSPSSVLKDQPKSSDEIESAATSTFPVPEASQAQEHKISCVVVTTEACDPGASVSSSLDPITRDVERRMSMKRDAQLPDDSTSHSEDGRSGSLTTRSTMNQAKMLAKSYGNFASGLFRGALQKVRGVKGLNHGHNKEGCEETSDSEGERSDSGSPSQGIVRPRKAKKGPFDFEHLRVAQELNNEHTGPVWCMRFSNCGRLVATAGRDCILRVWAVNSHYKYFQEMRERYQQKTDGCCSASDVFESTMHDMEAFRPPSSADSQPVTDSVADEEAGPSQLFASKPFAVFKGHTADILDISWSKNYFLLSSGMDRTVKLWHLSRNECLCCFQHVDFVTCVAFLPKDDRYFISASLDGKLRLWHIPDKKVAVWNEVQDKLITALTFVKNGKYVVVGTYYGRCVFYMSDQLKYHTVVDVRSTRGKNARGHKVTGLAVHGDKLLVTSNDSRIRMYDVRDMSLTCKFRGAQNERSQIRAAFSPDGRHIVCGSEDKFVYIWKTDLPSALSVRKDRNAMWERVRTHNAAVTVAVFAPKPQVFFSMLDRRERGRAELAPGQVVISADLNGCIKVLVNRPRLTKAGQSTFFSGE